MKSVLALIPARSGSKGVKDKNLRTVLGRPLIWHSIHHALLAQTVQRVIVSTDSEKYARIAVEAGAEVPFLRPGAIAGDASTDLDVFRHALNWLLEKEGRFPEICVHLRPTCPIRDVRDIDRMVELLIENPAIDSVRSIVRAPHTPYKMWFLDAGGSLSPVIGSIEDQLYNQPRQALRMAYLQNACVDVVRSSVILNGNSMSGTRIMGFEMDHLVDIDTLDDLNHVRKLLVRKQRQIGKEHI